MKVLIFILGFLTISCNTNQKLRRDFKQIRKSIEIQIKGFIGNEYEFSESPLRNLNMIFINDTTLELTNKTKYDSMFYRLYLNSNCRYIYKSISLTEIVIIQPLSGCGFPQNPEIRYLRPYEFKEFTIDNNAIQYIFPDITNDTLRFSTDLKRLQVREFSFEKSRE